MNEKQLLAFELYYSMGFERSYSKVAKEIGVTKKTIGEWASKHKWQDLIKERDKSDAEKLRDEVFKAKLLALKVISAGSKQVLGDIESGTQKVLVGDFTDWIKCLGELSIGETVDMQSGTTSMNSTETTDTKETKDVIQQIEDSLAALGGEDNG